MTSLTAALNETRPPTPRADRWSMAARCPRQAAYHALGEQAWEPDRRTQAYLTRGHVFGDYHYTQLLQEGYSEDEIVREPAVRWPGGVLHPDFYLPARKLVIEGKSHTDLAATEADITQLAGQTYWHPEAEQGELWITDPSSLEQRRLPFTLTRAWIVRLEEIAALVVAARETGVLPPRPCEKPADGFQRLCPFISPCFQGWEPPPRRTLTEEATRLVVDLYRADRERHERSALGAEAETRYREIAQRLADLVDAGVDYEGGGVKLRRVAVKGRTTWDVAAAIECGAADPDTLEPFRKTGSGHDRWSVERVGDLAPPADDGGVPF